MVTLSIIIPCYNSQDYMEKAIDSALLPGFSDIEALVVDDGSNDRTAEIADGYSAKDPQRVRVIHQENRGHGGAVNTGIREARGRYVKVLDSDDLLDARALSTVMEVLRGFVRDNIAADLLLSNYVYEKAGAKRHKVMRYASAVPRGKVITWDQVGKFRIGQYLMMHSLLYRTDMLREIGLELPVHTSYEDHLFVTVSIRHVRFLYYIDADLYRYSIGRADQSVNEAVMIRRIDQQIKVNMLLIDNLRSVRMTGGNPERLIFHQTEIVTAISSIMLMRSGPDGCRKKAELWEYIRQQHPDLHRKLKKRLLGFLLHLPGTQGRRVTLALYAVARRIFNFN
jgi:glycosyltransferase involved in cell wall biosynthesis